MNVRLLRRIQKQIAKEPKQFDMGFWFERKLPWKIPNCGTAACIGGWAVALHNKVTPENARKCRRLEPQEILELDYDQAGRLFYKQHWPDKFLENLKSPTASAKQAVARIDHFIKTKGAE